MIGNRESGFGVALRAAAGNRIIGGMFGLPPDVSDSSAATAPTFLGPGCVSLANGRSALRVLFALLAPPQVWLPSYLCPSVLEVVDRGSALRFYEVDASLQIASVDWLQRVNAGDAVVAIDYFGFRPDPGPFAAARARGAWIVEDACQALLTSGVGGDADFVVFSPRKFVGVPDGGVLVSSRAGVLDPITLAPPPADWWRLALEAALRRREFDADGVDRGWFSLFQTAEETSPVGPFSMSELARTLLTNCFDYADIARRRINNYRILAETLAHFLVFPSLPSGVVPLGCPIRIANRDAVLTSMFAERIYPPVHWHIRNQVPDEFEASHGLASTIMTVPCDQRYGFDDMQRMAALIQHLGESV
jgi:dTDP-4-amino-4,6-dideoxygalactose transaminase